MYGFIKLLYQSRTVIGCVPIMCGEFRNLKTSYLRNKCWTRRPNIGSHPSIVWSWMQSTWLGYSHILNSSSWKACMTFHTWASYQIRKIAGCACAGNAGNVFPRRRFQRKPQVSDPDMHHGTCVTHVPWCMSGSRTCGDGENVPGIPGACAPAILRIWQEAHLVGQCI